VCMRNCRRLRRCLCRRPGRHARRPGPKIYVV
jgi:hypothetical protein